MFFAIKTPCSNSNKSKNCCPRLDFMPTNQIKFIVCEAQIYIAVCKNALFLCTAMRSNWHKKLIWWGGLIKRGTENFARIPRILLQNQKQNLFRQNPSNEGMWVIQKHFKTWNLFDEFLGGQWILLNNLANGIINLT